MFIAHYNVFIFIFFTAVKVPIQECKHTPLQVKQTFPKAFKQRKHFADKL